MTVHTMHVLHYEIKNKKMNQSVVVRCENSENGSVMSNLTSYKSNDQYDEWWIRQ